MILETYKVARQNFIDLHCTLKALGGITSRFSWYFLCYKSNLCSQYRSLVKIQAKNLTALLETCEVSSKTLSKFVCAILWQFLPA